MQFELWQAGDQALSTRRMTTLHLMLAIALFATGLAFVLIFWFLYPPYIGFGFTSIVGGLCIAAIAILNKRWLTKGKRSLMLRFVEIGLFALGAIFFMSAGQWVPGFIFSIIVGMISGTAFLESKSPDKRQIRIDVNGIMLPKGFNTKRIRWDEVEELILRHNILSIELTGNRLVQRSIEQDHPDANALEAFSSEQIQKHAAKRAENATW